MKNCFENPSAREAYELTGISADDIKRRVAQKLGDAPAERERTKKMKRKILISSVVAAALCCTAAVAAVNNDYLRHFFTGDTSAVEAEVKNEPVSARIGDFQVTLLQSLCDDTSAYLSVSFQALSETAKQQLDNLFTWYISVDIPSKSGSSCSFYELKDQRTEDTAVYLLNVSGLENTDREPLSIHLLDPNDEQLDGALLIDTANALSTTTLTPHQKVLSYGELDLGHASNLSDTEAELTVETVTLSPLSLHVTYTMKDGQAGRDGYLFFEMQDGTICSLNHLTSGFTSSSYTNISAGKANAQFRKVTYFAEIKSIVLGGTAYPLDGGEPYTVTVDEHFTPFILRPVIRDENAEEPMWVPVRALCEGLGAALKQDGEQIEITYCGETYVFPIGEASFTVPGEETAVSVTTELVDGELIASYELLPVLRVRDERINISEESYGDWLIVP